MRRRRNMTTKQHIAVHRPRLIDQHQCVKYFGFFLGFCASSPRAMPPQGPAGNADTSPNSPVLKSHDIRSAREHGRWPRRSLDYALRGSCLVTPCMAGSRLPPREADDTSPNGLVCATTSWRTL